MSTPISPSQAAFNTLEVNLKAVLLQTGSALSHTSSDNGNSLLSTRTHLEKALPDALRKWHGALNDLEEQLVCLQGCLQPNKPPHVTKFISGMPKPLYIET